MALTQADIDAIWLTFKLASTVTAILLCIALPLGWWLSKSKSVAKPFVASLVAMPLILPPTVLGFYMLLLLSPQGPLGQILNTIGAPQLAFSFWGLVIASLFYSLPFVVQPIQTAFDGVGQRTLEVAATLRSSPIERFSVVALPIAKPGIITAAILGFAHTIGEFGVVLMIGGNIPNETQVVSILIYEHVEALEYSRAHWLSACLIGFSFCILFSVFFINHKQGRNLIHFGARQH